MNLKMLGLVAALAIVPATAFAQGAATPPGQSAPAPGQSIEQINPDMVTRDKPFGEMDMSAAMEADADLKTWAGELTEEQRVELSQRCAVIEGNTANYNEDTVTFCTNYGAANAQ